MESWNQVTCWQKRELREKVYVYSKKLNKLVVLGMSELALNLVLYGGSFTQMISQFSFWVCPKFGTLGAGWIRILCEQ